MTPNPYLHDVLNTFLEFLGNELSNIIHKNQRTLFTALTSECVPVITGYTKYSYDSGKCVVFDIIE